MDVGRVRSLPQRSRAVVRVTGYRHTSTRARRSRHGWCRRRVDASFPLRLMLSYHRTVQLVGRGVTRDLVITPFP